MKQVLLPIMWKKKTSAVNNRTAFLNHVIAVSSFLRLLIYNALLCLGSPVQNEVLAQCILENNQPHISTNKFALTQ